MYLTQLGNVACQLTLSAIGTLPRAVSARVELRFNR